MHLLGINFLTNFFLIVIIFMTFMIRQNYAMRG